MFKAITTTYIRTSTVMHRSNDMVLFANRDKAVKSLPKHVDASLIEMGAIRWNKGRLALPVNTYVEQFGKIEKLLKSHAEAEDRFFAKIERKQKRAKMAEAVKNSKAPKYIGFAIMAMVYLALAACAVAVIAFGWPYILGIVFAVLAFMGLGDDDFAAGFVVGKLW